LPIGVEDPPIRFCLSFRSAAEESAVPASCKTSTATAKPL
jgi:hypothetical protein